MPQPKRPKDPVAHSRLIFDMLTGEVPNDKAEVLADQSEPTGPAKAAATCVASQTPSAGARWPAKRLRFVGGGPTPTKS